LPTPESFPKGISIRRCMKISISITPACPWKPRFSIFWWGTHQDSVFWCLPKANSHRRYSNNMIPAHPWKPRSAYFMGKTWCVDDLPTSF
jgi:hypothetical protein